LLKVREEKQIARGHPEGVALLLAAPGGAAPALLELRDEGSGDGRTALAKAAAGGHAAVILQLLAAGADARATDKRGRSPRALAEAAGHRDAAALLPPDSEGAAAAAGAAATGAAVAGAVSERAAGAE
jgi:ankyrin repeat protein